MSLRDLVDSDCGGSNSLVKFSTHFVQDHGLKDQGIIQPTQTESNEQQFLESHTEELADQYFCSVETDTFKMDNILDAMRGVEADVVNSREEAWPSQFYKEIDKQDQPFNPNIWSSSENKMLVKDEVYDLGYNPEWVQEIEHSYDSQENNATKSRFDFDINKEDTVDTEYLPEWVQEIEHSYDSQENNATKSRFDFDINKEDTVDTEYLPEWVQEIEHSYDSQENNATTSRFDFDINKEDTVDTEYLPQHTLMDDYQQISHENGIDFPTMDLGMGPAFSYQFSQLEMFRNYSDMWEKDNMSSTMSPNTFENRDPSSIIGQSATPVVKHVNNTNESENISIANEYFNNPLLQSQLIENMESVTNQSYSFTSGNEMESLDNPLVEGKRRLENGELPTAVLCFEAAVKQEPSNAEAWQLLGTTQAENEQDQQAICALNKCIALQPENLTAVHCLAACYTNESSNALACKMLMEWLHQNPKYTDIVKSKPLPDYNAMHELTYMFTSNLYENVKDMYIEAAQRSLEIGDVDVDVQNGLGVLLNLNNENDKAVDCFRAALQIRPQDARLWNRLGATLANGGRCEEAIEAYHNALQLCPGFVRARYNLGITCIHLDTYREAIDHLLEALNQQASAVITNTCTPALSDTIWSTLRLAISLTDENRDMLKAVNDRNLELLNEKFNYNGLDQSKVVNED